MKTTTMLDQVERLEDQLQAVKWTIRVGRPVTRITSRSLTSVVTRTAGLLRGRLPQGRLLQRRLRREWERRVKRETS